MHFELLGYQSSAVSNPINNPMSVNQSLVGEHIDSSAG